MSKSIADYKKDYERALARKDYQGMKNANDGANAIRKQQGQAIQDGSPYITQIKSNQELLRGSYEKGSHESHQSWINNPSSGEGGMNNYIANQQNKLDSAYLRGDRDMIQRLEADMARVGYSLEHRQMEQGGYYGGGGGGGGGGGFSMPDRPTMRSGRDMADHLGLIYDHDYIKKLYQDAVNTKYANLDAEYARTQDMYYDNVAQNADLLMDSMRRGDRDAVQTGMAQGTQAANEMSLGLGVSADAGVGATELAQGRSDLVYKREHDLANVEKDALKYYNDLGINIGQLSASELNALVTAYAAEVATAGGVYNTDVLAGVERDKITSNENIASADRISRENIATWQNASNEKVARETGLSQQEVERIRAEYQTAINDAAIKSNEQIAAMRPQGGGSSSYGGGYNSQGVNKQGMTIDTELSNLYAIVEMNKDSNPGVAQSAMDRIIEIAGLKITKPIFDPRLEEHPGGKTTTLEDIEKEIMKTLTPEQGKRFREGVAKRRR